MQVLSAVLLIQVSISQAAIEEVDTPIASSSNDTAAFIDIFQMETEGLIDTLMPTGTLANSMPTSSPSLNSSDASS